jgi:hypothetical protein
MDLLSEVLEDHGTHAHQRAKTSYQSLDIVPPNYSYDGNTTIAHWPSHRVYFFTFLDEDCKTSTLDLKDRAIYAVGSFEPVAVLEYFENLDDALRELRSLLTN